MENKESGGKKQYKIKKVIEIELKIVSYNWREIHLLILFNR